MIFNDFKGILITKKLTFVEYLADFLKNVLPNTLLKLAFIWIF